MFIFERETVWAGKEQRERETQNPKQASGSELTAQSPAKGLNSWTMSSWPEPKLYTQQLSHPEAPKIGSLDLIFWEETIYNNISYFYDLSIHYYYYYYYYYHYFILFEREREREHANGGEGQRGRENLKQALCSVHILTGSGCNVIACEFEPRIRQHGVCLGFSLTLCLSAPLLFSLSLSLKNK